jgi:AcrR family transcriptional regulator
MSIPVGNAGSDRAGVGRRSAGPAPDPECQWATLEPAAKRERLLRAATAVAAAAGAGVASVYRQFPSKRELLAALVARRLDQIADEAALAEASEGDRWSALVAMLWKIVERQSYDDFLGEARVAVSEHADVRRATRRATRALETLLAGARDEGRLRADATTLDLRLLFAATRAAKQVEPAAWRRMLELSIDSLERRGAD